MTMIYEWPLDWYKATAATFYLQSRSQSSSRPWLGGKSVYGPHAQIWVCKMTISEQEWDGRGQAMSAFFSRLDGQAGLMRIGHVARLIPQWDRVTATTVQPWSDGTFFDDGTGWESGTLPPLVHVAEAASRGARYIVVGGLPVSSSRVLRRGDLFEIRPNGVASESPNLYEVQFDAPTNSSGATGIEIRPALRQSIAAGDTIVLRNPTSVFRVVDDDQGAVEVTPPMRSNFGFTLVEAIV